MITACGSTCELSPETRDTPIDAFCQEMNLAPGLIYRSRSDSIEMENAGADPGAGPRPISRPWESLVDRRLREGLILSPSEVFASTREGRPSVRRRTRHRPHHFAFVGAIVAIADALGLEATDEDVENQDQLASLNTLGCRRRQAFYLARPIPAADMNPVRGQVIPLAGRVIR